MSTLVLALGACSGGHGLARRDMAALAPGIAWFGPTIDGDAAALARWRANVGPPVVVPSRPEISPTDELTVITWNVALGAGDVVGLINRIRERRGIDAPIVLLLQEVFRGGPEVPRLVARRAGFAPRLRGLRADGGRDEIETIAAALGMGLYYVPSMRNGGPGQSDEDRGNAILSTLPMSDLSAVELPFERQRRVAVAATVHGVSTQGTPWRLRLVSAHLDNMVGPKRLWIAGGEFGRARQARGLVEVFHNEAPIVLGGDFNTWFGFSDQVYVETLRAFPQTRTSDTRATFHGLLRLDHVFYRLPDGWRATVRRADSRFGSDHFPLLTDLRIQ